MFKTWSLGIWLGDNGVGQSLTLKKIGGGGGGSLKPVEKCLARKVETYVEAFWGCVDSD